MSNPSKQRDPGLLIATLLALSTGLAILLLAESLRAPTSTRSEDQISSQSVDIAHQFYGAVNHLLETGDATTLNAVAMTDIKNHGAFGSAEDGRTAMIDSLVRLRTLAPSMRLTVDWVAASSGGQVSVGLRAHGGETGSFAGLELPLEARTGGLGPVEELRIEDGRVVERWGGSIDAFRFDELARITVEPLPEPSRRVMALVRLTLPPRSYVSLVNSGHRRVLIVEEGHINITDDATAWADTVPVMAHDAPVDPATARRRPGPIELASHDVLATGAGERLTIASVGAGAASILVWARYAKRLDDASGETAQAVAQSAETATLDASSPGVDVDILGTSIADLGQASVMTLGRVSMSSGSTLTWSTLRASCVVLGDTDDFALTSAPDPATRGRDTGTGNPSAVLLNAGGSPTFMAGDSMYWHADQPSTVLIVTVATATTDAATPVPNDG